MTITDEIDQLILTLQHWRKTVDHTPAGMNRLHAEGVMTLAVVLFNHAVIEEKREDKEHRDKVHAINKAKLPKPANGVKLLESSEVSEILGVSIGTLSVWRSTGRYSLPFVKIGKSVKYRLSDINEFINARTRKGHNDAK